MFNEASGWSGDQFALLLLGEALEELPNFLLFLQNYSVKVNFEIDWNMNFEVGSWCLNGTQWAGVHGCALALIVIQKIMLLMGFSNCKPNYRFILT